MSVGRARSINGFVVLVMILLQGCALPRGGSEHEPLKRKTAFSFQPKEYILNEGSTKYALIDVVSFSGVALTLGRSVEVVGQVEHFGLYPKYTETPCQGKGYTEELYERSKLATNRLKLKFFINGEEVLLDHKVTAPHEKVDVAVYAEYEPLSEFIETGALPVENQREVLTSGKCRLMCPYFAVAAIFDRKEPKKELYKGGCNYWLPNPRGGADSPGSLTDMVDFRPIALSSPGEEKKHVLKMYEQCGLINDNEALSQLYEWAATMDCNHYLAPMRDYQYELAFITEARFVDHRVVFSKPYYSITNFSQIVQGLSSSSDGGLMRRPVFTRAEFGN